MNTTGVRGVVMTVPFSGLRWGLRTPGRPLCGGGRLAGQPVACAASTMTWVTVPGSEIIDRCGAPTSVMCACARVAMNSCSAGGMTWSWVPTTAQDGMVCQAGVPEGSVSVPVASGRTGDRREVEYRRGVRDGQAGSGLGAGQAQQGVALGRDVGVDVD